ncbi:MAG: cysteine rich repeat-containing protein [Pseudomonadota bacterium]
MPRSISSVFAALIVGAIALSTSTNARAEAHGGASLGPGVGAAFAWKAWRDCAPDRSRLCGTVAVGGGRVMRCLIDQRDRVAPRCRRHVVKAVALRDAFGACRVDVERFCRNVVPGRGRVVSCLAGNRDRLRPSCRAGLREARRILRH